MRLRLFALPIAIAAAPALAGQPAPADQAGQPQQERPGTGIAAEFVTGVEYQQGDLLAGERVEIFTVQNAARLRTGRTTFSASLPWHRIEAPGNVVGGGGLFGLPIIVDPTRPSTRDVRQELGDLRIGVGHALEPVGGFELSLSGQVKVPTASAERGVGTGETDVEVGAQVARQFGALTPFASVGYTMPGEPKNYELENGISARVGTSLELGRGMRGSVSYGYAESLSPRVSDEQQILAGLSADLSRSVSLGFHGIAGLSNGSTDVGAGVSVGFRLF